MGIQLNLFFRNPKKKELFIQRNKILNFYRQCVCDCVIQILFGYGSREKEFNFYVFHCPLNYRNEELRRGPGK